MKKASLILTIIVMALSMLAGCKTPVEKPSASPNVPVVSETPAIPSPDLDVSPGPSETMVPAESLKPVESMNPTVTP